MKLVITFTIDIGYFLPLITVVEYLFKDTETTYIDGLHKKACFMRKRDLGKSLLIHLFNPKN